MKHNKFLDENAPQERVSLRNLWRFVAFSLPYWPSLTIGMLGGMARTGLDLITPWYLKYMIDSVAQPLLSHQITQTEAWSRTGFTAMLMGLGLIVHWVVTLGRWYYPFRAAANAIRDIRFQLFRHLQRLSLGFHHRRASGALVARVISDVEAAQQVFDLVLVRLMQQVMVTMTVTFTLFWRDWQWALVCFASTPLFLVTTRLLRRPMRKVTRQQRESVERMSGRVQERFSMIREIQAFTAEHHEERLVRDEADLLCQRTMRQRLLHAILVGASEVTKSASTIIVVVFGIYRISQGQGVTAGDLPLFVMYALKAITPLDFFADLYTRLQISAAAADRVFDFFDVEPDIKDKKTAKPLALKGPPTVSFDHVTFSYPTIRPAVVLKDISFEAQPGWRVVLVGQSGGGKSTLMSLLPRFYDVNSGRILINGKDIRDVTVRSLRQDVAIVSQEPVLFTGTIRENILYGRRKATDAEVRAAACAANAEQFILEMDDGYETMVGERGVGLSGGQIQRIAIARAFLKEPTILIMDEPTSNLDAASEALVLAAADKLAKGRTTFIIAHRLSVARDADCILVVDKGRIGEQGTHDDLLQRKGLYYNLWQRQMGQMPVLVEDNEEGA